MDNFTRWRTVFYTMSFHIPVPIWFLRELGSDSELSFDFTKGHLCSTHYSYINPLLGPFSTRAH